MKTRIIQTRFWDDDFVSDADIYTQHLYIYLLTSQYINISGIFQLPEKKIMFETKLTETQFSNAKKNLEENKKVFFNSGWVYVVNAKKNNNYTQSPKNEIAYERELSVVPLKVRAYFDSSMDTSMDSSMDTTPIVAINQKPEIINKKPERNSTQEVFDYYVERTGSKESLSPSRRQKIQARLKDFGLEECKKAIDGIFSDSFYQGENDRGWKADLDYIFRTYEITEKLISKAKPQERRAHDRLDEITRARMAGN